VVEPPVRSPLPAPELRDGPGLLLRRHRTEDVDGICEQCQDESMQRWTTVPVPYTRQDAEGFLAHVQRGWEEGATASFGIEVDGRFAGTIDLQLSDGAWGDVGFGLAPWARGRSAMSRSPRLVLAWGFSELALAGVQWRAHVGNHASRRVAEACGFRVEGQVRGLLFERGRRIDGWIGTVLAGEPLQPAVG